MRWYLKGSRLKLTMGKILGLLLLFALIVGGLALWRRARRKHGEQFIDSYPYQRLLDKRLAAKRPELTPTQREMVFDGLKEYFHLCNLAGRNIMAMGVSFDSTSE